MYLYLYLNIGGHPPVLDVSCRSPDFSTPCVVSVPSSIVPVFLLNFSRTPSSLRDLQGWQIPSHDFVFLGSFFPFFISPSPNHHRLALTTFLSLFVCSSDFEEIPVWRTFFDISCLFCSRDPSSDCLLICQLSNPATWPPEAPSQPTHIPFPDDSRDRIIDDESTLRTTCSLSFVSSYLEATETNFIVTTGIILPELPSSRDDIITDQAPCLRITLCPPRVSQHLLGAPFRI